jgi:Mitochondrial K+-H+ exchange-related
VSLVHKEVNVYFVPLAPGRFEPYYEQEEATEAEEAEAPSTGVLARMRARFSQMVHEAEQQRHDQTHQPPATAMARLQHRLMGWIAERVAEQRLLWRLRRAHEAALHVPDDLDPAEGMRLFQQGLQRDADAHLRRLGLHSLGLLAALPFVVVPGPNVLGYFFTFTVVGHFLAYRGAKRGLTGVRWSVTPSPALATIGRAVATAPPDRYLLIHDAAHRLRLAHLARFVERMVAPPA